MKKKSLLSALVLAALAQPLAAQEAGGFEVLALSAGQAAQVHVANAGGMSRTLPCHISVEFSDVDGNAIGDARLGSFALRPGKVASLSIDHPNLRPGERYLVRVQVRRFESKGGRNECDAVRATAEIFDTDTGKTTIVRPLTGD